MQIPELGSIATHYQSRWRLGSVALSRSGANKWRRRVKGMNADLGLRLGRESTGEKGPGTDAGPRRCAPTL